MLAARGRVYGAEWNAPSRALWPRTTWAPRLASTGCGRLPASWRRERSAPRRGYGRRRLVRRRRDQVWHARHRLRLDPRLRHRGTTAHDRRLANAGVAAPQGPRRAPRRGRRDRKDAGRRDDTGPGGGSDALSVVRVSCRVHRSHAGALATVRRHGPFMPHVRMAHRWRSHRVGPSRRVPHGPTLERRRPRARLQRELQDEQVEQSGERAAEERHESGVKRVRGDAAAARARGRRSVWSRMRRGSGSRSNVQ